MASTRVILATSSLCRLAPIRFHTIANAKRSSLRARGIAVVSRGERIKRKERCIRFSVYHRRKEELFKKEISFVDTARWCVPTLKGLGGSRVTRKSGIFGHVNSHLIDVLSPTAGRRE